MYKINYYKDLWNKMKLIPGKHEFKLYELSIELIIISFIYLDYLNHNNFEEMLFFQVKFSNINQSKS